MEIFLGVLSILLVCIFLFFLFLKVISYRISKLENKIQELFLERSALIPSIFEVSRPYVNKHHEIFSEILKLRKREFSEKENELYKILETKKLIHHEINFIFKICNKHPLLIREGKFIYLRNLIIKKSSEIGENIEKYKIVSKQINKLIQIKNYTLIGLFFPVKRKVSI